MRLPKEKHVPILSDKVRDVLTVFSKSRTAKSFLVKRSKIILYAADGMSNKEIGLKLDLHPHSVSLWRKRFIEADALLLVIENEDPEKLGGLVAAILSDEQRSGAPLTYNNETRCKIKIMACQNPSDYGFTASHWSLSMLQKAIEENGVACAISIGAIYNILITDEIRPWKIRYYLHSKDKYEDYETYAVKISAINKVYAEAKSLCGLDDPAEIRTFCTDEMTGIQALEHLFPDKPTQPGADAKREFEYIRHGTTSLTGFFDVTTGKMEAPYLNATRNEDDFVKALKTVVDTSPNKTYRIICDNLNTHMSEKLVLYVAEQIGYTGDLGKKRKTGILKDRTSRAAFLSDTTHRICFYYLPIHCSWMNQIEIWFGIISRQLLKRKSFISVDDLEMSIRNYITQYNKYFAHPFNWKYNRVPKKPESKDNEPEKDAA